MQLEPRRFDGVTADHDPRLEPGTGPGPGATYNLPGLPAYDTQETNPGALRSG